MERPQPRRELTLRQAFYSPRELADQVGCSPATIRRYIRGEKLYAVRLSPRRQRIPYASVLLAFFPEQKRPTVYIRGKGALESLRRWEREWRAEHPELLRRLRSRPTRRRR